MEPGFPFHAGIDSSLGPELCRLALVQRGAVRLEWRAGSATLLPGALFLIPAHAGFRLLRGKDAEITGFSFAASLLDPLALDGGGEPVYEEMGIAEGGSGRAPMPRVERLPSAEHEQARSLFAALGKEAGEQRPGFQAMVRLRLMEAILLMYRVRRGTGRAGAGDPLRFSLAEVQRYLQESFSQDLTLPGIAARYGLNPSYFSRLFHQEAGIPLVAYINRLRIERSCQLLKRTRIGILEIAFSVGYRNVSHFNRSFRKIVGMSPREYRSQADKRDRR